MRVLEIIMQTHEMTNEEKKRLSYQRQNAVRLAWKNERNRVENGYGTRKWSAAEQEELISRGAVHGYEGHHMKSVSLFPEYAGEPRNIQFLSETEHLWGAHNGNYHTPTNGYYDPTTGVMYEFKGSELPELRNIKLSNTEQLNSKTSSSLDSSNAADNRDSSDYNMETIVQQRALLTKEYSAMDSQSHHPSGDVSQLQKSSGSGVSCSRQEGLSNAKVREARR